MNRNSTLIAAVAVILIGVAAFAVLRRGDTDTAEKPQDQQASETTRKTSGISSSDLKPTRTVTRSKKGDEISALELEYGESRTNLSKQIVTNVTTMLDDVLEMGDMMTSGQGGQFGDRGNWVIRGMLRDTGVELDEEQKDAAKELYREFQIRELEKSRQDVEAIKANPSTLMKFMLASDARSKNEIDEVEFAALQKSTADQLKNILNPLERNNFRGGQPMQDEQFRSDFQALLSEDQAASLSSAMADRDPPRQLTNITEMPVMDLESIDQSISSAKQMTSGFKDMMQGMGNLQQLQKQRDGEE